jgi:hypothetical protein
MLFDIEDLGDALQKMMGVAMGMKSDKIGSKQTAKNLFAPRKQTEEFEAGKRNVEKKSDGSTGISLTEQFRQQKEMIVVDPDIIPRIDQTGNSGSELFVDALVCSPMDLIKERILGKIVE